MATQTHYLLIGNSRWHWASQTNQDWAFFDTEAPKSDQTKLDIHLKAWAAVGPIPTHIYLDPVLRLNINEVPLLNLPPWLGIDRALAGWGAFKKIQVKKNNSKGILIADAGTVFSITRIQANGEFAGGKLLPGINLQLKAMSEGTRSLSEPNTLFVPEKFFPKNTQEAMLRGTIDSLIGALIESQKQSNDPIWLCGGNASIIYKELQKRTIEVKHYPNLVLEGMIDLKS